MKPWHKKLDVITNIAIIICCVLFLGFLARAYFFSTTQTANNAAAKKTLVGERLDISSVNWSNNSQTLVLFLQKGCRFCEESVPFYQRLIKSLPNQNKTRLIAVFPHNIEESKKYLEENQMNIPEVIQSSLKDFGVAGTPTLLLVNNEGKVIEQWTGKLPNAEEDKVIQKLL